MPGRKEKQYRVKGVGRAGGWRKVSKPSMWGGGLAEVTVGPWGYLGSRLCKDTRVFGDK